MFNRSSFSPVSFSRTAWAGIQQQQQEGRSGYWRLFYHQLQEAALNAKKVGPTKLEEAKFEPHTEQPDGSVVFGKAAEPKAKSVAAVVEVADDYVAETMRWHYKVQRLILELSGFEPVTAPAPFQMLPLQASLVQVKDEEEDEEELLVLLMN